MRQRMNAELLREVVQKLVPLLAGKGLKVTQRGSRAYVVTDTRTHKPTLVNIPNIPDEAPQDLIDAIQGFIDHEVGHVLHTDWELYHKGCERGDEFASMLNIIEDPYVELAMQRQFPGSRSNLANTGQFFLNSYIKPQLATATNPAAEFNLLMVPYIRGLAGQELFREFIEDNGYLQTNKYLKDLDSKITKDMRRRFANLRSTADTFKLAEELLPAFEQPKGQPGGASGAPMPGDEGDADGDSVKIKVKVKSKSDKDEDSDADGGGGSDADIEIEVEDDDTDDGDGGAGDEDKDDDASGSGSGSGSDDESSDDGDDEEQDAGGGDNGASQDKDSGPGDDDEQSDDSEPEPASEDEEAEDSASETEDEEDGDEPEDEEQDKGEDDEEEPEDEDEEDAEQDEPEEEAEPEEDEDHSSDIETEESEEDDEDDSDEGDANNQSRTSDFTPIEDLPQDYKPEFVDPQTQIMTFVSDESKRQIRDAPYRVYTTDFDKYEVYKPARPLTDAKRRLVNDQVDHMIGPMSKELERLMAARSMVIKVPGFRSGKLNPGSLHRLTNHDDRIFRRKQENRSKETAVFLLVDNSGSMSGTKMGTAMKSCFVLSRTLERIGIINECMGFTTTSGYEMYNESMKDERESGISYSRYDVLDHRIYKSFDERLTPAIKDRFISAAEDQFGLGGNIDGEAVQLATRRLLQRREARKVLIVLSDGHPAGSGEDSEQYANLHRAVDDAVKAKIDTVGIGIQSAAVSTFYPQYCVIQDVSELPSVVMNQLRKFLFKPA